MACQHSHAESSKQYGKSDITTPGPSSGISNEALHALLERLPLEIVLHITSFLPRPQYNVLLSHEPSHNGGHATEEQDGGSTVPDGPQSLLYRSFENELDALKDIYRLNSYARDSGQCICCHSFDALRRLNFHVQNRLLDEGGSYTRKDLQRRTLEIVRSEVRRQSLSKDETRDTGRRRDTFELDIVDGHFEKRDMEWLRWACRDSEND